MAWRRVDQDRLVIYYWFFCEVTVVSLVGVALWLSLTPRNPRFTISAAHFPQLNHTTSLVICMKIFNPNNHMGIDYSGISFKLYAAGGVIAANSTPGFRQGYKNITLFHMPIQTTQELWNASSDVDFMLSLETAFRFRIIKWRTKIRHIVRQQRFSINLNGSASGSCMELQNAHIVKTRN
ncbi:uncharacterized protein LOC131025478 [Salvia miltiorrhiza]|uniref:uncharacterized protein LOC131025478 n=1 Tax=Salvia miltiorrhiza TaxID=226208 RepID=UPI0025ABA5E5|nr:uncharacterized protein LOC131025478 [Salvia miltiorrhiza]